MCGIKSVGMRSRLWLPLCLALLCAGGWWLFPQETGQQQTSPKPTPTQPSPNLDSMTPSEIWIQFWPIWQLLRTNLESQIEQQQQQAQTQQISDEQRRSDEQTISDLQQKLLTASQAQTQASTSTTSATVSSTQSSTDIQAAQISQAQEDKDIKAAVFSLEVERTGWKLLGISAGVLALGEAVYIAGHVFLKAW